jgi:hypothetical protein
VGEAAGMTLGELVAGVAAGEAAVVDDHALCA